MRGFLMQPPRSCGPCAISLTSLQSGAKVAKPNAVTHRFKVLGYLSAWVLALSASAGPPAQPRIYGGSVAKNCEFPTTIYARGCTGTLIHPSVVLSAGHCPSVDHIEFGESASRPALSVPVKWCESTHFEASDARICVLQRPVLDLPTAPIIQGCEIEQIVPDASVLLAGFGLDQDDPVSNPQPDEKRWVATKINQVAKEELSIGGGGKGGCQGDSGGPVYLKLRDGTYRTIGVTHGGVAHPNCDRGIYKRSDRLLGWYESKLRAHGEQDIDLSPCFDDAGAWAPTENCGGYTKDVKGPNGDWSNHCGQGMARQRYSASCGSPFDASQAQGSTTSASSANKGGTPPPVGPNQDSTASSPSRSPAPAPISSKQGQGSGCRLSSLSEDPPLNLVNLLFLTTWLYRRRPRPLFQECGKKTRTERRSRV